jgi:hypothetical protein
MAAEEEYWTWPGEYGLIRALHYRRQHSKSAKPVSNGVSI